jgi:hypothetical protein
MKLTPRSREARIQALMRLAKVKSPAQPVKQSA